MLSDAERERFLVENALAVEAACNRYVATLGGYPVGAEVRAAFVAGWGGALAAVEDAYRALRSEVSGW